MVEYNLLCQSLYFEKSLVQNLLIQEKLKKSNDFSSNSYLLEGYMITFSFFENSCNSFKIHEINEKDLDLILNIINFNFKILNIKYVCTDRIKSNDMFEELLYKSKEIFSDMVINGNNIMRLSNIMNDDDNTDFILNKNYYSITDDNIDNLKEILHKLNHKTDVKINILNFNNKYILNI